MEPDAFHDLTLMLKKPNAEPRLSIQLFGRDPARRPSGTAMTTAINNAVIVHSTVAGSLAMTVATAGSP